jgi:hypothetical protein
MASRRSSDNAIDDQRRYLSIKNIARLPHQPTDRRSNVIKHTLFQ